VAEDTYRLAETIGAKGTGCHIFTSIEVVADLPDTALPLINATSRAGGTVLVAVALGVSLACWLAADAESGGSNVTVA
jgi:hypothetical protein